MAIALAAVFWPPVARGARAFSGIVWLGLLAGLLLVPSIGEVLNQLLGRGPQTLLPSPESAYPWLLALTATSLFAGLGLARRILGETALRRSRLVAGGAIGIVLTVASGTLFAGAAIANDLALRDQSALSSRFGPTGGDLQPPSCDGPLLSGTSAALELRLTGDVDGRPVGAVGLTGERDGSDVRWTADVATSRELGRFGIARIGERTWTRGPRTGWLVGSRGGRGRRPRRQPGPDHRARRRDPDDRREPRPGVRRGRPEPATAGSPSTAPPSSRRSRRLAGSSATIRSAAGAGSSTTGSSPTASSGGSPAA